MRRKKYHYLMIIMALTFGFVANSFAGAAGSVGRNMFFHSSNLNEGEDKQVAEMNKTARDRQNFEKKNPDAAKKAKEAAEKLKNEPCHGPKLKIDKGPTISQGKSRSKYNGSVRDNNANQGRGGHIY